MNIRTFMLAVGLIGLPVIAHANDAIESRKGVFKEYKKVFGAQMGDIMKGKAPYEAAQFAELAKKMESLSKQAWQHFPSNSKTGDTKSLPEIWSKPAEFKAEIEKHEAAASKLAQTAASAKSLDDVRPQFLALQKTCKSCHDQFKAN